MRTVLRTGIVWLIVCCALTGRLLLTERALGACVFATGHVSSISHSARSSYALSETKDGARFITSEAETPAATQQRAGKNRAS